MIDKETSLRKLRELLPAGATVATLVQYRTPNTTYVRVLISPGLFPGEPGPSEVTAFVSGAMGRKLGLNHAGIPVREVGTNPEAGLILDLCRVLFRDGFACTGEGCPSAEHGGNGGVPYSQGMPHRDVRGLNHNRLG
jgi:hypothetical protein